MKLVEPFFKDFEDNVEIINLLIEPIKGGKKSHYLNKIRDEKQKDKFIEFYNKLEILKEKYLDVRFSILQRSLLSNLSETLRVLEEVLIDDDPIVRYSIFLNAVSNLFDKGILNRSLTILFEGEPLFSDSTKTEVNGEKRVGLKLKRVKPWNGIWISNNDESKIKYRDIDAYKIGNLIRVFAVAEIVNATKIDDLKQYKRLDVSIKAVVDELYRTYLKQIQQQHSIGRQSEAKQLFIQDNEDEYKIDIKRILSETISQHIYRKH